MPQQLSQETICNECLKREKILFEHYKRSAEEEGKYTTIVLSLVYASMLSIFSTVHTHLLVDRKALFLVFLILSLLTFIVNEIWKMLMGFWMNEHENELWNKHYKGEISINTLEMEVNKYNAKLFKTYYKYYPFTFGNSLIFGGLTAILLLLECLYIIF